MAYYKDLPVTTLREKVRFCLRRTWDTVEAVGIILILLMYSLTPLAIVIFFLILFAQLLKG